MGVNLSIKNVPEDTVARLKLRARRNHRSLQGELLALIDEAIGASGAKAMTIAELSAHVQSLGLKTRDEATRWIREDRDRR